MKKNENDKIIKKLLRRLNAAKKDTTKVDIVKSKFDFAERASHTVKGKGEMKMFFVK